MVICKFFLQGTCKFGDFCKFEHQLGDSFSAIQNQGSTSILRQPHFGTPQQTKPTNPLNVDTNTLVKSVVNDMTVAEKGGQWLLSCYAPFKEKPGFPGFEDCSFEEVRLGHYEAVKNGTLEQYKHHIQMMLQQAVMKLKSLQVPSPDIVNILKLIYNTPPSSHSGVFGNNTANTSSTFNNSSNSLAPSQQQQQPVFGSQPSPPIFAQANQSLLGKPTQPQNNYGGTSNIFRNATQNASVFNAQTNNPLFTNNQPQNANKSIFSQANSNFGTQSGGSIFGGQPGMQTTTASIFGSTPVYGGHQASTPFTGPPQVPANSSNIFNKQGNTMFGIQNNPSQFSQAVPQNNIFGAPPNTQVNQPFGPPNNMQPPVNSQAQNQIFGAATKNPVFTQQGVTPSFAHQNQYQNTNSPFGQQLKSALDAQNHSSNIFGGNQPGRSPNLPLRPSQPVDETVYSKLEDLTEDEIKWFENDDLDILNIPEKPPTYEMCFKT